MKNRVVVTSVESGTGISCSEASFLEGSIAKEYLSWAALQHDDPNPLVEFAGVGCAPCPKGEETTALHPQCAPCPKGEETTALHLR